MESFGRKGVTPVVAPPVSSRQGCLLFLVGPLDGSNEGGGAEQNRRNQDCHAPKEFVERAVWVYASAYPRKKAAKENQTGNDVEEDFHGGASFTLRFEPACGQIGNFDRNGGELAVRTRRVLCPMRGDLEAVR